MRSPFLFSALLTAVGPLAGCGGAGSVSPATNFNDCVSVGGTVYTVDGPVGEDDGSYPCSLFRAKGVVPSLGRSTL